MGPALNREQRRRKGRARFYRGPDDTIGITHTRKGAPHHTPRPRDYSNYTPDRDPNESNHERVVRQRQLAGRMFGNRRRVGYPQTTIAP